jgi:hypothetical protein
VNELCEALLADAQKPDAERNRHLCLDAVARIQVLETIARAVDATEIERIIANAIKVGNFHLAEPEGIATAIRRTLEAKGFKIVSAGGKR